MENFRQVFAIHSDENLELSHIAGMGYGNCQLGAKDGAGKKAYAWNTGIETY